MLKNPVLREVVDWIFHITIAIVLGFLIVKFVAQVTIVYGESMEPTLQDGNRLLIEKITPRIGKLKYGDIVTIKAPEFLEAGKDTVIKRVIAVENDKIEIRDGSVYVNGKKLQEQSLVSEFTDSGNPNYSSMTIPKHMIYVLGDNRGNSLDSRVMGPLDIDRVGGKVVLRLFPLNKFGFLNSNK